MKDILILPLALLCSFLPAHAYSQSNNKPPLDSLALVNWPSLAQDFAAISNNGKYMYYTVEQRELGNVMLYIQPINRKWLDSIPGVSQAWFSSDSKQLYYYTNDTLYFHHLEKGSKAFIPGVIRMQQPRKEFGEWIAYETKKDSSKVFLHNIITGKSKAFSKMIDFQFSENASVLLITALEENGFQSLYWASLPSLQMKKIWSANQAAQSIQAFAFDTPGSQLAILISNKHELDSQYSIAYYQQGMSNAEPKAIKTTPGIKPGLTISENELRFTVDGRYILFELKKEERRLSPNPDAVSLDVWNYKDKYIQSYQLKQKYHPPHYAASISIQDNAPVIQWTQDNEFIETFDPRGDYTVIKEDSSGDRFWLGQFGKAPQVSYYIISLVDGSRIKLDVAGYTQFYFSPTGKYIIYFNKEKPGRHSDCYSYDLESQKIIKLNNAGIPNLYDNQSEFDIIDSIKLGYFAKTLGAWSTDEKSFFINDTYDIWKIDLADQVPPECITKGYGRDNKIKLRFLQGMDGAPEPVTLHPSPQVLVSGYNTLNKQNSFYYVWVNKSRIPLKLSSGNWAIYRGAYGTLPRSPEIFDRLDLVPLKAKNSNTWLVVRQTFADAPNFFVTKDFKIFEPLTNLRPQENYNWLIAELITFPMLNGKMSQGVLYKPENFDSTKNTLSSFIIMNKCRIASTNIQFLDSYQTKSISHGLSARGTWYLHQISIFILPKMAIVPITPLSGLLTIYPNSLSWIAIKWD
jgi:dipeptidyl aminopeptidase/acylaminoacyl peptidase